MTQDEKPAMIKPLMFLMLLFSSATVLAQSGVYRTVDENGNVVFTDAPAANSGGATEEITISPTNTSEPPPSMPAAVAPTSRAKANKPRKTSAAGKATVAIVTPEDGATITTGVGNFELVVQVSPELSGNQQLQLRMGGDAWDGPQQASSWSLANVANGTHVFTVDLLDEEGQVIASSDGVSVNVIRNMARPAHLRGMHADPQTGQPLPDGGGYVDPNTGQRFPFVPGRRLR